MQPINIQLNNNFCDSLSTRSVVKNLFSFNTDSVSSVVVDFKDIRLISSSAAHQFILEKKCLEKKNIEVVWENVDPTVKRMLDLAGKNRKNMFNLQSFQHHTIDSNKELDSFLLGY